MSSILAQVLGSVMRHFVYSTLLYLLQPLLLVFLFFSSLKAPQWRKRLGERYGLYGNLKRPNPNGVVIHASSVGEVIAATPLIKQIQQQYPTLPITVTTMTPTGSARVTAVFGQSVQHIYLPLDLPDAVARFLDFVQPKALIVIETEIWANLIHQCNLRQIPFLIVNARLSARSAQRYGKFTRSIKAVLNEITLIAPQDEVSAKRYSELGFPEQRLKLTGNIKYDLNLKPELLEQIHHFKQQIGSRPVWIAASTHEGEDEFLLKAHRALLTQYPDLLLILVPRHPERFAPVAELIARHQFKYVRRSEQRAPDISDQVLLGDTMGELMLLYGVADVAFVGGSLIKRGGHNPLEPLAFKLPVISGQYVFNFPEVFSKLQQEKGIILVESDSRSVAGEVQKLLDNPKLGEQYGNAGFKVLIENRGALRRVMCVLQPYLQRGDK